MVDSVRNGIARPHLFQRAALAIHLILKYSQHIQYSHLFDLAHISFKPKYEARTHGFYSSRANSCTYRLKCRVMKLVKLSLQILILFETQKQSNIDLYSVRRNPFSRLLQPLIFSIVPLTLEKGNVIIRRGSGPWITHADLRNELPVRPKWDGPFFHQIVLMENETQENKCDYSNIIHYVFAYLSFHFAVVITYYYFAFFILPVTRLYMYFYPKSISFFLQNSKTNGPCFDLVGILIGEYRKR